jgi:hypothetical protein
MESGLHLFRMAANACGTNTGILPSLYDGLGCTNGTPTITSLQDVIVIIGNLAQILLALAGGLAVIFIIVGAIFYIISAGDPGRIKRGKDILTNAIVGLLIILSAYAVVTFIAKGLN